MKTGNPGLLPEQKPQLLKRFMIQFIFSAYDSCYRTITIHDLCFVCRKEGLYYLDPDRPKLLSNCHKQNWRAKRKKTSSITFLVHKKDYKIVHIILNTNHSSKIFQIKLKIHQILFYGDFCINLKL